MARWGWWLLLAGCDDFVYGLPTVGAVGGACDDAGAGFSAVESVVAAHCLVCHAGAAPLGGLALDGDLYTKLTTGVGSTSIPYVVPGEPESSYLYQKLTGTNTDGLGVMPPGGGLPSCLTDPVGAWITDGALQD